MRVVRVGKSSEAEVPTTWSEGEAMIANALGAYYDGRGKNLARLSIAARVIHGMFGRKYMAAEPTLALLYLGARNAGVRGRGSRKSAPSPPWATNRRNADDRRVRSAFCDRGSRLVARAGRHKPQ